MLSCTAGTYVHSQPDRVFGVFTDLKAVGERLSAIEEFDMVTDGPMGKGSRVRVTFRAEPRTWTTRAMSTVLGGTLMRAVEQMLAQDLAELKAWGESY